jgi:hypothetical protein
MDNMVTPNIDLKNDRSSFRFRKTLGQKIMEEWASPGAS